MSRAEELQPRVYFTIVDGTFRTQVDQNDPKAVKRDWTSADGKSHGTKYERVFRALYGYIKDVSFADTQFGMQIYIKLDKDANNEEPTIALNVSSREAEDFMKKLPNIDLSQEVQLRPFNFTGDKDDEVRGISVMQPDEFGEFKVKVSSFFSEPGINGGRGKAINGFPEPRGDVSNYTKDHWKIYFTECRLFLIDYTKQQIAPKIAALAQSTPVVQSGDDQFDRDLDAAIPGTPDPDKVGGGHF